MILPAQNRVAFGVRRALLSASCFSLLACTEPAGTEQADTLGESSVGDESAGEGDAGEGTSDSSNLDDSGGFDETAGFIPEGGDDDEDDGGPDTSMLACDAFDNAPHQAVIAAANPEDAATNAFVPEPDVIYDVTLPEEGLGYVQLQIAGWGTTQAFYTDENIAYVVTTDTNVLFPEAREPIPGCEDSGLTEQKIGFPHWDPALVEFSSEGPRLVPLLVIED